MQNKQTRRGFTLIELLVVVLIIGILAAVAVPQYQNAVRKSKAGQIISLIRAVANAQEVYYLNHGVYATSFEDLDVDIPDSEGNCEYSVNAYTIQCRKIGQWEMGLGADAGDVFSVFSRLDYGDEWVALGSYLEHRKTNDVRKATQALYCSTSQTSKKGKSFCAGLGGKLIDDFSGVSYYNL